MTVIEVDEVCRSFITGNDAADVEAYLDTIDPQKFDSFVSGLVVNIHNAIGNLESRIDNYYHLNEEGLTGVISGFLEGNGYSVKNEAKTRGKIDLTVEKGGFSWLIEAKIGYGNTKIFEGLLQLASRYLTDQRSAGFFIYFQKAQPTKAFALWKTFIESKKWVDYATNNSILEDCNQLFGDLSFSDDKLCVNNTVKKSCFTSAGSPCQIYTFGVNCFFKPIDVSGRGNKSLKKNQAIIDIHHAFHNFTAGDDIDIDNLMCAIDEHFSCSEKI